MTIDCPKCGHKIDLDNEDLPDRACDDEEIECSKCDHLFLVGWYATAELR